MTLGKDWHVWYDDMSCGIWNISYYLHAWLKVTWIPPWGMIGPHVMLSSRSCTIMRPPRMILPSISETRFNGQVTFIDLKLDVVIGAANAPPVLISPDSDSNKPPVVMMTMMTTTSWRTLLSCGPRYGGNGFIILVLSLIAPKGNIVNPPLLIQRIQSRPPFHTLAARAGQSVESL